MTPSNSPLISIVTVVKDDLNGFIRTANSIQLQDSKDFEWVVIDGSQTLEISEYIFDSINSSLSIKYFRHEPRGIYSAMNIGLQESSGKLIWYLNAGDFLSSRRAISLVHLEASDSLCTLAFPVLHATAAGFIYAVTSPIIKNISKTENHALMNHQGVLVPRKLMLELGGFDETLKLAADGKLLDLVALNHEIKICSSFLVVFTHGGVSSSSHKKVWLEIDSYRTRTISEYQLILRGFKSRLRTVFFSLYGNKVFQASIGHILTCRSEKILKKHKIDKNDLDILFV